MPHLDPLLDRNRDFAAGAGHADAKIMPRNSVFVLTCLDPRTDPAAFLGLDLGDAMVVRNAGGRATPEVLADIAFISALAELQLPDGPLFEVAIIHHTQCGTGFLAADAFRGPFAERTGRSEDELLSQAVTDPESTVRADVERVRRAPAISDRVSVSGHVYDVEDGTVRTVAANAPMLSAEATGVVS